jgi:YidC/Oxa1 family membrane protein insertase
LVNGLNIGVALPFIGQALPILALIAGLTTYYQSKMMQSGQSGGNDQAASTQNTMTKIMPLMIFFFALNFPAGLTLYWTVSNTFQIVQQYIALNKGMKIREAK